MRLVAVGGLLALAATACGGSSGGGSKGTNGGDGDKSAPLAFSIDNTANGPAYDVPDHTTGGTIYDLEDSDFSHLDPARIYVNNNQSVALLIEPP